MNPLCLLEAEQNRSCNLQFIWLLLQAYMSWIKFHTKIPALQLSYSEKGINISINIIYKVCEFTGSSAIVTGWSLSTEVLGFLDSYVVSRHLLKQVSAGNLVAGAGSLSWSRSFIMSGKCSWSSLLSPSWWYYWDKVNYLAQLEG